jgi:hypothetical protein
MPDDGYITIPRPVNQSTWQPCLGFVGNGELHGIGAKTSAQHYQAFSVVDATAHLEIPEHVEAIVLDLWWDHGVATGIRSQVVAPDGTETFSSARPTATMDDPIRVRFDHPAAGNWDWTAVADPVAAGMVLHFNEGLYFETPESLEFICNVGGTMAGGQGS